MSRPIENTSRSKGFTLIEVVIAMSIAVIGALGGYALLANVQGTISGNTATIQAQQDARNIVERIARELREASPEKIWPDSMTYQESDYVTFFSPRDANRTFVIQESGENVGEPEWQRAIAYVFHSSSNRIYRYQLFLVDNPDLDYDRFSSEVVAENVESLAFTMDKDLITISIRTFADRSGSVGNVSRAYADYYTELKLRN